MKNAKAFAGPGGISIVGILTDQAVAEKKEKKPLLSFNERVELAEAIRYNDCVVAQKTYSPLSNLKQIKPDIVIESTSHASEEIEKIRSFMESIEGRMVVFPYYPSYSSSKIKKWIKTNHRNSK